MLTWLDWYVMDARQSFVTGSQSAGLPVAPAALRSLTDRQVMAEFCRATMARLAGDTLQPADLPTGQSALLLLAAIYPFVADEPIRAALAGQWGTPHGIQPSAEVVADLANARPPAGSHAEALAELRRASWYIDLPHGSLLLNDRQQVRCLFVQTSRRPGAQTAVLAIITAAGSNRVDGRVAWEISADGRLSDLAPLVDAPPPLDGRHVRLAVMDFLYLLMLYRLTAVDPAAEQQELPRGEERVGLTGKSVTRERVRRRQISLFRIVRLLPRPGRLGRHASGEQRASWRLDHLVSVRGFFRLQPYGPGSTLRRLIWVEPHTRGPQAAPRTDLDQLAAPPEEATH